MKKFLLFIAFTIFGLGLNAQNVGTGTQIDFGDYSLNFKITDVELNCCEVVSYEYDYDVNNIAVIIPLTVTIEGIEYSVTSIGYGAFADCYKLTSIEIPSSVTSIGDGAFRYCSNLTSVTFGDNSQLTSIGYWVFAECYDLTSIEIPSSVTSIGDEVFYNCSNLTSVTFGDNSQLTSIGYWVFNYCSNLISIEIPSSVTFIGSNAFAYCNALCVIKCYAEDVPETSYDVFYGISPNMIILVPATALQEYQSSSPWNEYNLIAMPEEGEPYIGNYVEIDYDDYSLLYVTTSVSPAECMVKCSKEPTIPTSITIPSTVEIEGLEYSVTSFGNRIFYNCDNLTSIEIPSSITSIVDDAFYECSNLKTVTIVDNSQLTSIGNSAFADCYKLTSIEIPTSVTSIGERAFSSCSSLTSIEIPSSVTSIGDKAFSYCEALTVIKCYAENVPLTAYNTFYVVSTDLMILVPATALEEYQSSYPWSEYYLVAMPEEGEPYIGNIVEIDYDDYSLIYIMTSVSPAECMVKCSKEPTKPTSITIPSTVTIEGTEYSVTSIGYGAFADCYKLTSIEIPSSVTSIGNKAFYCCSNLKSIEIPSSVTSIEDDAFYECSNLKTDTIGDNSQLTSIGRNAFYYCINLTSIEIPSSVTSIGDEAFYECSNLKTVTIGDNSQLTSIGRNAFYYCSNLTSIEIPSSVNSIGDGAFRYCSNLTSVTFGDNSQLASIGNSAFADCYVTCIEIPSSVTSIGPYAFGECPLVNIEIPSSVTSIGGYAFAECWILTSVTFGDNSQLTSIGDGAFRYCSNLTSVTFGDNSQLTSIGEAAFAECLLINIEIPSSVTSIGDEAFAHCGALTVIKCYAEDVPETGDDIFDEVSPDMMILVPATALEEYQSSSPWNEYNLVAMPEEGEPYIGNYVEIDYDDYSLIYIMTSVSPAECMVKCSKKPTKPTSITIPSTVEIEGLEYSVTSIGNKAFYSCRNLTSIEIPSSVNSIGNYAFAYCYDLEVIKCYAEDVPDASEYWFGEYYYNSDLIIYVPKVSLDDYKYTYPWSEYTILSLDDFIPEPKNLEAKVLSSTSILLSWDAVENATSYNVYQYEDIIANVEAQKDMTYLVENLKEETEYWFRVTTLINDKESIKSTVVYAITKKDDGNENPTDTIVPTPEPVVIEAPENFIATAESISSISLKWDEVENAESYNIYRDGDSIANVTNPTYTDKDLEYNTEYCYIVTAVRTDEESEESEEVCAKTLGESIEELSSSINIYPNPVDNKLFLATEVCVEEIVIYDVYGRTTTVYGLQTTDFVNSIDVADLESGIYFVKVVTNEGEVVKRFVKK